MHVVLDLGGRLKFGPDVEYLPDRQLNYDVDPSKRHAFAESFRNMRSWLLFSGDKAKQPRLILVTSAVPLEGKSMFNDRDELMLAAAAAWDHLRNVKVEFLGITVKLDPDNQGVKLRRCRSSTVEISPRSAAWL